MNTYTISLSGPVSALPDVTRALEAAEFEVKAVAIEDSEATVMLHHDDIEAPRTVVQSYGWRLAMHSKVVGPALTPVERYAEYAGFGVN